VYIERHVPRIVCINNEKDFWPNDLFDNSGKVLTWRENDFNAIRKKSWHIHVKRPLFNRRVEKITEEYFCGESSVQQAYLDSKA
jgi:hypothetical protein